MSDIFRVFDVQTGRQAVLKTLHKFQSQQKRSVDRVWCEARIHFRLDHPCIARVFDVGYLKDGCPYLVMEWVDGVPLSLYAAQRGPLNESETIEIGLQICDALRHVHEAGFIHCDVKPQNILVSLDHLMQLKIKLIDFGVAVDRSAPAREVIGTLGYMSPEQMQGHEVDVSSDVYSLGCTLYSLLSGTELFNGDGFRLLTAHLAEETPKLSKSRPGVSDSVSSAIARALEKEPRARFDSMAEFKSALRVGARHQD
jgi:serine/threonine-protein kinase